MEPVCGYRRCWNRKSVKQRLMGQGGGELTLMVFTIGHLWDLVGRKRFTMKSIHQNRKTVSGILRCRECGQECTQVEFYHGFNLCDHLALDAMALDLKKKHRNNDRALQRFPL